MLTTETSDSENPDSNGAVSGEARLLVTGDRKDVFSSLSLKIVPNGTIYKNPAGVSEASRIVSPVAIAECRSWLPSRAASDKEPSNRAPPAADRRPVVFAPTPMCRHSTGDGLPRCVPHRHIRLARERQVNVRVVPTGKAIEESVDLASEIFNRVFRKVPERADRH